MDYKEVNRKLTAKLVEERRINGIEKGTIKRHEIIAEIVSKYADKSKPLLEIGVREGFLFDHLIKHGFENLYGVDISLIGIKRLRERGYKGHISDAQNLTLDKTYDTIVISHCLEHCPEPTKVVDGMYKALNEGGILYVEVPKQPKEPVPTKWSHYYCFSSFEELMNFFPKEQWELIHNEHTFKCVFRRR